jgi:hypothetical protein
MPDDNQSKATALLSQLPLGAIIGGPLKAAVDAQAAAAAACYEFIQKIGFEPGQAADAPSKTRTVTFTYERHDAGNAAPVHVEITVPILSIMPLPFIRIESLTVNFKAAIGAVDESTKADTSSSTKDLKLEGSVGVPLWKVSVGGSISSKKDSTATNTSKYSVENTMDISLHVVQDDMPAGLAKLLNFMTENIVAVTRPTQAQP